MFCLSNVVGLGILKDTVVFLLTSEICLPVNLYTYTASSLEQRNIYELSRVDLFFQDRQPHRKLPVLVGFWKGRVLRLTILCQRGIFSMTFFHERPRIFWHNANQRSAVDRFDLACYVLISSVSQYKFILVIFMFIIM